MSKMLDKKDNYSNTHKHGPIKPMFTKPVIRS